MRAIIGFTTYMDLEEATPECFFRAITSKYGPGNEMTWIIKHLKIIEDNSKNIEECSQSAKQSSDSSSNPPSTESS